MGREEEKGLEVKGSLADSLAPRNSRSLVKLIGTEWRSCLKDAESNSNSLDAVLNTDLQLLDLEKQITKCSLSIFSGKYASREAARLKQSFKDSLGGKKSKEFEEIIKIIESYSKLNDEENILNSLIEQRSKRKAELHEACKKKPHKILRMQKDKIQQSINWLNTQDAHNSVFANYLPSLLKLSNSLRGIPATTPINDSASTTSIALPAAPEL